MVSFHKNRHISPDLQTLYEICKLDIYYLSNSQKILTL